MTKVRWTAVKEETAVATGSRAVAELRREAETGKEREQQVTMCPQDNDVFLH